jgi:long-chain fatty acid transport protein
MKRLVSVTVIVGIILTTTIGTALGQGYGSDSQNVLTPAAGGMAGVSLALPQDAPAAVFGNPATLAQFHGTQFTLGGAWIEGYPTVSNDGTLNTAQPGTPFSVTSRTEGFLNPEIAVVQDLRSLGISGGLGLGLAGLSGIGAEYRGLAPQSSFLNNVSNEYLVLGLNFGAGVNLTDRLAAGASLTLGNAFEQLGFVGPVVSTAMVNDYALRGNFGFTYDLNPCNTVGVFYQTRMDFQFPNAVRFNGDYRDLNIDQPATVGLGIANHSLMDGCLLLAADIYYKEWENAALWQDVFVNQWAFAFGAQLAREKMRYRLGYSYNTDPINHSVGDNLDGFPIGQANVQLFQAASTALISQHRITGGFGRQDFLTKGLDIDFLAGGLFGASDDFGAHSSTSLAIYYLGMGLTWRYGAATCPQ